MICDFKSNEFDVQYIESNIEQPILWESHCHSQYEMIAVAEGDITVMVEGQSCRLKKNQILIVSPLLYHYVTANEKGIYCRITALFGVDVIPNKLRDSLTKNIIHTSIHPIQIEKLKKVCQEGDWDFYAPLLHSLMVELFYDVIQTPSLPLKIEHDELLQKAFGYIDQHLHEKILLDDLAKYTSRSKSSFCHLFESKMHISPKQYILQKKLALASKLIDEGVPRTVAAIQVGYENYSNFYRLYRKNFEKN